MEGHEGDHYDMVGLLLLKTMYGRENASQEWQDDYGQHRKESEKFERGVSNPALFFHEVLGKYDFKVTGRFSSVLEEKQIERYKQYLDPDARYVDQLMKELELEGGAIEPGGGPAVKRSDAEIIESEHSSPGLEKEPKRSHWELLKRVGRYLKQTQFVKMVSIIQAVGCRLDGAALKGEGGARTPHRGEARRGQQGADHPGEHCRGGDEEERQVRDSGAGQDQHERPEQPASRADVSCGG